VCVCVRAQSKDAHELAFDYINWRLQEENYEWETCPRLGEPDTKRLCMRSVGHTHLLFNTVRWRRNSRPPMGTSLTRWLHNSSPLAQQSIRHLQVCASCFLLAASAGAESLACSLLAANSVCIAYRMVGVLEHGDLHHQCQICTTVSSTSRSGFTFTSPPNCTHGSSQKVAGQASAHSVGAWLNCGAATPLLKWICLSIGSYWLPAVHWRWALPLPQCKSSTHFKHTHCINNRYLYTRRAIFTATQHLRKPIIACYFQPPVHMTVLIWRCSQARAHTCPSWKPPKKNDSWGWCGFSINVFGCLHWRLTHLCLFSQANKFNFKLFSRSFLTCCQSTSGRCVRPINERLATDLRCTFTLPKSSLVLCSSMYVCVCATWAYRWLHSIHSTHLLILINSQIWPQLILSSVRTPLTSSIVKILYTHKSMAAWIFPTTLLHTLYQMMPCVKLKVF